MKKLPIGIQTFSEIRNGEYIYVDKTKSIAELIEGKYYFLSRPRRFGKSLLVDTLKQIFLGNKELFKGLWIENQIDWQAYPVIHIDFSGTGYKSSSLPEAISGMMEREATRHGIHLAEQTYDQKFRELVVKLSEKGQVVVLIDEYDKPIIDYLDNIPQAVENREILKTFYSPVKPIDPYLKFVLITGVSKFSHISIFSDLNNLRDITVSPQFAELLGITFEEILRYFDEYLVKWEKTVWKPWHSAGINPTLVQRILMGWNELRIQSFFTDQFFCRRTVFQLLVPYRHPHFPDQTGENRQF
ncbi:MAG: AAA family ATPase [Mangrovibacterium sp.]